MQETCKQISIKNLAALCGGKVTGNPDVCVCGVASVTEAQSGNITFLSGAKNYAFYLEALKSSRAAAVIAPESAPDLPMPSVRLKNPYYGLIKACEFFYEKEKPSYHIHKTAFVSEKAKVSPEAFIGPMAVIEDYAEVEAGANVCASCYVGKGCKIGGGTMLYPGVRVLSGCSVGKNCILHSNAVVGSDGFGFTVYEGKQLKVPQLGCVIIEDNVEIGACTAIDRGAMSDTQIGEGTKIDNHVHVAHNVQIGKNCVIVAKVGISGSTIIEDNVTMAGQAGTAGHVRIGKGATIAARGVVTKDVEAGAFVSGFPIKPHAEERKIMVSMSKLPELIKRVRALEHKLTEKEAK